MLTFGPQRTAACSRAHAPKLPPTIHGRRLIKCTPLALVAGILTVLCVLPAPARAVPDIDPLLDAKLAACLGTYFQCSDGCIIFCQPPCQDYECNDPNNTQCGEGSYKTCQIQCTDAYNACVDDAYIGVVIWGPLRPHFAEELTCNIQDHPLFITQGKYNSSGQEVVIAWFDTTTGQPGPIPGGVDSVAFAVISDFSLDSTLTADGSIANAPFIDLGNGIPDPAPLRANSTDGCTVYGYRLTLPPGLVTGTHYQLFAFTVDATPSDTVYYVNRADLWVTPDPIPMQFPIGKWLVAGGLLALGALMLRRRAVSA